MPRRSPFTNFVAHHTRVNPPARSTELNKHQIGAGRRISPRQSEIPAFEQLISVVGGFHRNAYPAD